ncbi:MAG TPA: endolytic transglycosylase MltG [Candidatus Dormibacteraeota bacterium]|nr:endolytic transglycosylase MltG [Candidatus Dormibacteraeota bacterium]
MRRVAAVIALGIVVTVAGAAGWLVYQWQSPYKGYTGKAAVVNVERGTTTHQIAEQLRREAVVRSGLAFELWSRLHRGEGLEAGEYRFDRAMTPPQVFEMIAQGRVWNVTLTVPEGWTMFDIADAVQRDGLASRAAFLRAARHVSLVRDIAPDVPTLEGFLFPATYQFPHRTTAQAIVAEMVRRFHQAWANLTLHDAPPPNLTLEQVVTLASLVEEETPRLEEKPIIAGVFLNRLRLGYPLECDPSVVYALKLAGRYGGQLHASEMGVRSPYNTYLHYGLPPGPIGNPGMASLRAVLEPARTDYLYFVANGKGGHMFSRTLAEHRRDVARYRRLIAAEKKEEQTLRQQRPVATHGHPSGNEPHE